MTEYILDNKTNNIFETEEPREFFEKFSRPNDLIILEKVYCDGSGYNGKETKESIVHLDTQKIFKTNKKYTNNESEYRAILVSLEYIFMNKIYPVIILSDSQVVIFQINGQYKCKAENLQTYLNAVKTILKFKSDNDKLKIFFKWIPREKSLAGKLLEV